MECNFQLQEGKLTILVPRELDHHCADQLKQETDLLIDAYHVRKLIFDFSKTEFMDSSGIGVLLGRSKNMGYMGGQVIAQNLNDRVDKIFRVAGLYKMITVNPGEENREE